MKKTILHVFSAVLFSVFAVLAFGSSESQKEKIEQQEIKPESSNSGNSVTSNTNEEKQESSSENSTDNSLNIDGEIIGKWECKIGEIYYKAIIYKKGSETYMKRIFNDGSGGVDKLTVKGNKYLDPDNSELYMKIEPSGNLGHYGSDNQKYDEQQKY